MYVLFRLFAEEIIVCELTRVKAKICFELLPVLKYVSPVSKNLIKRRGTTKGVKTGTHAKKSHWVPWVQNHC